MCDDAILYSGFMDKSYPLYSLGMFPAVSAATSYVAMAICIRDSYWYDDPRDYFVACAADARFSNGMNARKRSDYSLKLPVIGATGLAGAGPAVETRSTKLIVKIASKDNRKSGVE